MSELKQIGKIKLIGDVQQFDSGFKKVEFVVTSDGEYPQDIKFEIVQDKVDNFLKFNDVGQKVEVSFNIRGNEYQGKHYVSLQAWKVFTLDKAQEQSAPVNSNAVADDLPF